MAKKIKSQSSFSENKNLIYALVVLFLIAVLYWTMNMAAKNNYSGQPNSQEDVNNYPAIENSESLNQATKDLDGTNLDAIDMELKELDTNSSSF